MRSDTTAVRPASLTLRVTAFVGITVSLVLIAFGWLIDRSIEHHFAEQDASELQVVAQSVRDSLTASAQAASRERLAHAVSGHHGVFFLVLDSAGNTVYSTEGPDLSPVVRLAGAVDRIDMNSLHTWHQDSHTYRVAVVGTASYTIVVAAAMDFHLAYIREFRRTLWIILILTCGVAVGAAWLAVFQGHRPLRALSDNIRSITSDQLSTRLAPQVVPIELEELVLSFNSMIARIEEGFERLSNFSADIAHELRTPVTNLTTQTQVALSRARQVDEYREVLYSSLEEYERMARMISDMLLLAQTDNGLLKPDLQEVDLETELRSLFDYFDAWAEEQGVSIELSGHVGRIQGDRSMLRRALSNLLSNAIRYTDRGGKVRVQVGMDTTEVAIEVTNTGQPIAPQHLSRLFDRFFRGDPSRQRITEGAGLGLSIVKSIIESHGGDVSARSANQQTVFRVVLPRIPTVV